MRDDICTIPVSEVFEKTTKTGDGSTKTAKTGDGSMSSPVFL